MGRLTYSFVVPIYNEEATLGALHERLSRLLDRLDGESEVLLVDDGSVDASYPMMVEMNRRDPRFKVVELSRNFGHQLAITSGLDLAEGDAVIIMDADLQDPPEVVPDMIAKWREGFEVVYGIRDDRSSDGWFKRTSAECFYRVLRRLTDIDVPFNAGDFRLIDRRAVEAFKSMREGSRFVRGMFAWMGFRQTGVPYQRAERHAGSTKYPFRKMLHLATDGVVGFSRVPLRLALKIGFLCSALAFLGGATAMTLKITGLYTVPGWASVVCIVSFLGGLQLAVLGVMGEYLGRIYEDVMHRPLYIVRTLHGVVPVLESATRAVIAEPRTVPALLGPMPLVDVRQPADLRG